jgi:hypothetical protein
MFADDFDPVAALGIEACPRCGHKGLVETDHDTYNSAPSEARIQPQYHVNPSLYAQCPACRAVLEWPGSIWVTPNGP